MIYICLYSFGRDAFLSKCIKSIANSSTSDYFIDLYIFNSNKKKLVALKKIPNLQITYLDTAYSYSKVTNISINKAIKNGAEYFLLLNTDTILHPDCISNLVLAISFDKRVGIVGGYQTEYDGNWDTPNNWTNSTVNMQKFDKINTNKKSLILYRTSYVQGACMLFKTTIVNKIGSFNERFGLFYEETEFCRRAMRKGYTVGVVNESKVKHYAGGIWKQNMRLNIKRDLYYLSNQLIFESTANANTIGCVIKNGIYIIKKQIKNIEDGTDNLQISLAFYPLVLLYVFLRFDLYVSLYTSEKKYVDKK